MKSSKIGLSILAVASLYSGLNAQNLGDAISNGKITGEVAATYEGRSELNINSNIDDNYELLSIDKKLLDSLYKSNNSNPESIIALNVIGDSMEPTLINKEVILFDKNNIDISKGGIFIVSTNIGLLVKRIYLKLDGSIELISDNKNYNSEIIQKSELNTIKILGKVVGKVGLV